MGCHFLLQGILLTQGSNSGLPHCGQTPRLLSHKGIPPNADSNQVDGLGRTLGQGPQRPPDTSLSLGLLLTPQLLQRKRKKGTTKVKMRRRQWSVGPSPRWAQLGASQWPLPPHPNHQKTSSQSRPRRAVRDFRTLLHSEKRLADTPLQALGHHGGRRRNLHTQEPPFTPERGSEATGALPDPAVILNPPRDHLLPGWVCSVLSWLRRG